MTPAIQNILIYCDLSKDSRLATNTLVHSIMTNTKNIVILGGSYGGLPTAHYLLQHVLPGLPETETYKIFLVNPSSQVFCRPACPRAMVAESMFDQDRLFVDISTQLQQYGPQKIEFLQGKAIELDHRGRHITVSQHDNVVAVLEFHALIVATGATTLSPLLGLTQDTEFLQDCWKSFRQSLSSPKHIAIAGGGPSGVEIAGELGEFLNGRADFFSSRPSQPKVAITLITSSERILRGVKPSVAAKAETYLSKLGVTLVKNARVKSVTPAGAGKDPHLLTAESVILLEDRRSFEADLFIPATGTSPNTSFVTDKTLLSPSGHIITNPATLRVDKAGERIYAIGDVNTFARPAIHNTVNAIPVLCTNIKHDLLLAAEPKTAHMQDCVFSEDTRETQLVPIGKSKGVGVVMGWRIPGFLVWLLKGRDYWLWTTGNLWNGKKWAK